MAGALPDKGPAARVCGGVICLELWSESLDRSRPQMSQRPSCRRGAILHAWHGMAS